MLPVGPEDDLFVVEPSVPVAVGVDGVETVDRRVAPFKFVDALLEDFLTFFLCPLVIVEVSPGSVKDEDAEGDGGIPEAPAVAALLPPSFSTAAKIF